MEAVLNFARGPLFRLTFLVMLLGLARIFILDIWGAVEAYQKAGDKKLAWGSAIRKTIAWLLPVNKAFTQRPFYSIFAILFHIGLILVPIFYLAHVQLWRDSIGFGWITLSKFWADLLTLATIGFGLALFIGRVGSKNARFLSRKQDYIWPLLLIIPFITGYLCANAGVNPKAYQIFMLIHILFGELIFIFIPFTKIAHCVIMPLSQFVLTLAWKFPANVDKEIGAILDKKGSSV